MARRTTKRTTWVLMRGDRVIGSGPTKTAALFDAHGKGTTPSIHDVYVEVTP